MDMAAPIYYTAEMVRGLPDDGNRYEAVHGELLVTPAPRAWHQIILARLFRALDEYLRRNPVGHVLWSPADISWSPDTLVQPDLFVVPMEELRTLDWARMRRLLLVVEVVSPTTARADRFTKRRLYQEAGIPAYWIVDPDQQLVEAWTPNTALPAIARERVEWLLPGATEPFVLFVAELFRAV